MKYIKPEFTKYAYNPNMICEKQSKCKHAVVKILKMKCRENILKALGIVGSTA